MLHFLCCLYKRSFTHFCTVCVSCAPCTLFTQCSPDCVLQDCKVTRHTRTYMTKEKECFPCTSLAVLITRKEALGALTCKVIYEVGLPKIWGNAQINISPFLSVYYFIQERVCRRLLEGDLIRRRWERPILFYLFIPKSRLFTNVLEQWLKGHLFTIYKNNCSCAVEFEAE